MNLTFKLAWRNLWRQPRRTWLTTGAMVFSNVLLVFLISLQLGMYRMMIDNTLQAFTGHMQVQAPGYQEDKKMRFTLPAAASLANELRAATGLDTVGARAAAFALASSEDRSYGIQVFGVEPEFEPNVSSIPGLIKRGRFLEDPAAAEIVVGSLLAKNLRVDIGDEVTLLGSGKDGSFAAGVVVVVGIFESGVSDLDRAIVEMPLQYFQDIFSMGDSGHMIAINAPDLFQAAAVQLQVEQHLAERSDVTVLDWDSLQPGLQQAIKADLAGAWFMYGILIILVAFSVLNTQLMSVLERTREFGITMALGLTPGRLMRLIFLETALMGGVGLILGAAIGGALVVYFGVYGFSWEGMEEMAGKFNVPGRIYPSVSLVGLLVGPGIVFIGSLLAAIYPALRLHWLQPVAAMRSA
jgi:putative ABC transport system permease protein